MGKKYYVSSESFWKKEVDEGREVDEGIGVLFEINSSLTYAFDVLGKDKYGEMQTYSYSSIRSEIQKCRDKNDDLVNYSNRINGTLKDKENDFYKQFSRALEELSKLNINDYKVENTLGITEFRTYNIEDYDVGGTITVEQKKSEITYADIMGKTDMMGLSKQFEEYVNTQRSNQTLSDADISRLKEEFYDGILTTSFEHTVYNDGWLNGASELLDFIPVVSGVKSVIEGCVGYTLTGEKLSGAERWKYGVLGVISTVVDVISLGTASAVTQGGKLTAKAIATSFVKTAAIDIGVGYGTKLVTTGLMNLGLSPEMVMGIHILTNLAYMGYNMSKTSKVVDVDRAGFGTNGQEVSYVSDFFEGADDGIVRGSSEVKFYSVENVAGGKTYVSTDTITQKNFSDIVNTADGKITIITGAHGTVDGTLLPEKSFFDDDVLKWGNNANVTVVDVSELDIEDLSRILNGSGTNICAWCYSERSNSVLQALVFGK